MTSNNDPTPAHSLTKRLDTGTASICCQKILASCDTLRWLQTSGWGYGAERHVGVHDDQDGLGPAQI